MGPHACLFRRWQFRPQIAGNLAPFSKEAGRFFLKKDNKRLTKSPISRILQRSLEEGRSS